MTLKKYEENFCNNKISDEYGYEWDILQSQEYNKK
jgi:hypothetical protein